MKLTDTRPAILTPAADHPEYLAIPPERLPAGARQKVAQALLKQCLAIAVDRPGHDATAFWPADGDDTAMNLTSATMITIIGLIGADGTNALLDAIRDSSFSGIGSGASSGEESSPTAPRSTAMSRSGAPTAATGALTSSPARCAAAAPRAARGGLPVR